MRVGLIGWDELWNNWHSKRNEYCCHTQREIHCKTDEDFWECGDKTLLCPSRATGQWFILLELRQTGSLGQTADTRQKQQKQRIFMYWARPVVSSELNYQIQMTGEETLPGTLGEPDNGWYEGIVRQISSSGSKRVSVFITAQPGVQPSTALTPPRVFDLT